MSSGTCWLHCRCFGRLLQTSGLGRLIHLLPSDQHLQPVQPAWISHELWQGFQGLNLGSTHNPQDCMILAVVGSMAGVLAPNTARRSCRCVCGRLRQRAEPHGRCAQLDSYLGLWVDSITASRRTSALPFPAPLLCQGHATDPTAHKSPQIHAASHRGSQHAPRDLGACCTWQHCLSSTAPAQSTVPDGLLAVGVHQHSPRELVAGVHWIDLRQWGGSSQAGLYLHRLMGAQGVGGSHQQSSSMRQGVYRMGSSLLVSTSRDPENS